LKKLGRPKSLNKKVGICVSMDQEALRALTVAAAEKRVSRSEYIVRAIKEKLGIALF